MPLSVFSEQGVCMLNSWQKKLYSFSCGSYGTRASINFDQIINGETLSYYNKEKVKCLSCQD